MLGGNLIKKLLNSKQVKKVQEYLQEAVRFIEKFSNEANILDRIGELVDDEKREWVKKNLKNEVLKQLAIEIKVLDIA